MRVIGGQLRENGVRAVCCGVVELFERDVAVLSIFFHQCGVDAERLQARLREGDQHEVVAVLVDGRKGHARGVLLAERPFDDFAEWRGVAGEEVVKEPRAGF